MEDEEKAEIERIKKEKEKEDLLMLKTGEYKVGDCLWNMDVGSDQECESEERGLGELSGCSELR